MVYYSVLMFIIGSVFGSFYYVVGTRLLKGESLISPGSHCTYCNHKLRFFELIPIFSFLILKGKCHKCHHKLSWDYFIYEIFTGLLFLISYLKYGFSYHFFVMLIISSLLVLIFITDFKELIILDSPLFIAVVLLFLLKWIYFGIGASFSSLGEGILSFFTMFLVGKFGKYLFDKEALGGGDIKFAFVMGMILGYPLSVVALAFSSFLALPYAVASMLLNHNNEVPFGPFLVSSVYIVFFFSEKFLHLFSLL